MATYELREAVNITSQLVSPGTDEAALAGLEMIPSRIVSPPRVAASPVHLECRFHDALALPGNASDQVHHVVIGRVVGVHIRDDVLTPEGKLDVLKIRPIARLGYSITRRLIPYSQWLLAGRTRKRARPDWKATEAPGKGRLINLLPAHVTHPLSWGSTSLVELGATTPIGMIWSCEASVA